MEKKRDYLLPVSILIAALLVAGALVYSTGEKNFQPGNQENTANQNNPQELAKPQIDNGDVVLGDPNAPVTLIEFGDFQCPFCGKFFKETEPLIRENYVKTNKVKMVYKSLAFLGPESLAAAQAADCAKDQKKFWQYHDALFEAEIKDGQENNGNLNRNLFQKIASELNLNVDEFLSCFDSQKYAAEVKQDNKEAQSVMPQISTPTIFINDKMIQGAYPYDVFAKAIDEALNKK